MKNIEIGNIKVNALNLPSPLSRIFYSKEIILEKEGKFLSKVSQMVIDGSIKIQRLDDNEYKSIRVVGNIREVPSFGVIQSMELSSFYQSEQQQEQQKQLEAFYLGGAERFEFKFSNDLSQKDLVKGRSCFSDHNRSLVVLGSDNKVLYIKSAANDAITYPVGKKIDVGVNNELTETIIGPLDKHHRDLQEFILKYDEQVDKVKEVSIFSHIVERGSNFEDGKKRIKDIILSENTNNEKISLLKDEFGTGGGSIYLENGLQGFIDHCPGMGITYKLDNGQVFFFTWSKVLKLYTEEFNDSMPLEKEKDDVSVIPVKVKEIVLLDKDSNQLGIFTAESFIPDSIKKSVEEENEMLKDFKKTIISPIYLDIKKKVRFGMIKDNALGNSVLEKQCLKLSNGTNILGEFEVLYDNIMNLDYSSTEVTHLNELYIRYDLHNISGDNDEFENIMKATSIKYIKGAFTLRAEKIRQRVFEMATQSMDNIRTNINDNKLYTSTYFELTVLYKTYGLKNLEGEKGDFSNVFYKPNLKNLNSNFQLRQEKIIERMNEYDNPEQTLDEYYHTIRLRNFDFKKMNYGEYKKIIKGMSVIFSHDLQNVSLINKKETLDYIKPFMRQAKKYIIDNNMKYKALDELLESNFLKSYVRVVA